MKLLTILIIITILLSITSILLLRKPENFGPQIDMRSGADFPFQQLTTVPSDPIVDAHFDRGWCVDDLGWPVPCANIHQEYDYPITVGSVGSGSHTIDRWAPGPPVY
jgi:hypothetical protein